MSKNNKNVANLSPLELLREAEWWSRMADLASLDDAELLARARALMPRLVALGHELPSVKFRNDQ